MVNRITASGFGVACTNCGEAVIAPYWSQFVCQEQVRHFWICEACGHQFDTAVELSLKIAAKQRIWRAGERISIPA